MDLTSAAVEEKMGRLKAILAQLGPTLVAFSGGVDSSLNWQSLPTRQIQQTGATFAKIPSMAFVAERLAA